ncbi:MAG: exosortase/archaeosortase family protein [Akkermansiaceae bacterium]|nr:exosortase/archaeosortase family protein [Akkermansiaceae bacterium]
MNTRRITITLVLAIAFAPVVLWYFDRLSDGGGEPLGLIALAIALGLAVKDRNPANPRCAEIAIIVYGLGFFFLPPLLRAIPALVTIAFLTGMHHRAGQVALLLLSLPIQASLDFFLGFPFRLVTAEGAQTILNTMGLSVERLGVQLSLEGAIVSVDPPCSGLQMLWATGFLTAVLSALFKLSYLRTIFLGFTALLFCLLSNILRATFLVFPEAGLLSIPDMAHEGMGLLIFALGSLCIVSLSRRLQAKKLLSRNSHQSLPARLLATTLGVSLITLVPAKIAGRSKSTHFPTLTEYRGLPVEEIPLSSREKTFAKDFPGKLRAYRVGNDSLIVRHVTRATRMLHPSYHCLKAEGFSISNSGLKTDHDGHPAATYHASLNKEKYLVTETIKSCDDSRHWSDVSAWYWYALFNPNSGPWVAETRLTPISPESSNRSL